ncbi:MAG: DUF4465 domain-containing protein [Bacteroidales bacterium]|nr:DUF4465 domain-containing protein [Bacteroidales bacterium]
MKNSIKLTLIAMVVLAAVSCKEPQRSSANVVQVTSFDMDEYSIEAYFQDGILFAPMLSWDDVCFYYSSSDDVNKGFRGGFRVSVLNANDDTSEEQALITSADPAGGAEGSRGYAVFSQTYSMPESSITYKLTSFYSAIVTAYGCEVCNTLYNKRLADEGKILEGDYLKVKAEFFNGTTLLGSLEKYLIDYVSGAELKMDNEWTAWNMVTDSGTTGSSFSGFDSVLITVESSGSRIDPAFCLDNYSIRLSVEY